MALGAGCMTVQLPGTAKCTVGCGCITAALETGSKGSWAQAAVSGATFTALTTAAAGAVPVTGFATKADEAMGCSGGAATWCSSRCPQVDALLLPAPTVLAAAWKLLPLPDMAWKQRVAEYGITATVFLEEPGGLEGCGLGAC